MRPHLTYLHHKMNLEKALTKERGYSDTPPTPKTILAVHVDYLRMTHKGLSGDFFSQLLDFICENYTTKMDTPWSPGGGAVWFPHRIVGIDGFVGGFEEAKDGSITFMYQLPGSYWVNKSAVETWRILRGLTTFFYAECNRVDIAIDDSSYEIIPQLEMVEAYDNGFGMYFKKMSATWSKEDYTKEKKTTWYFGGRKSDKMHRVYDHNGECLRHECEFKGGYAKKIFEVLTQLERPTYKIPNFERRSGYDVQWASDSVWEKEVQKTMASLVTGQIDFREQRYKNRGKKGGAAESDRLKFWEEYLTKLDVFPYKVRPIVPKPTLQTTIAWIKRQCSGTLAMLREGSGVIRFTAWMNELIELGKLKMDSTKIFWAEDIKKHPQIIDFSSA